MRSTVLSLTNVVTLLVRDRSAASCSTPSLAQPSGLVDRILDTGTPDPGR